MPYRLKSRHKPVPGGYGAYDPSTNYRAGQYDDFETQARGWQQARLANPGLTKRYRKSTDMEAIRDEIDEQWASWAHDQGYNDFVITLDPRGGGGAAVPFPNPNHRSGGFANRVAAAAAGVRTIYEWIRSREEAVPSELANRRAATCNQCPLNEQGNLTDFFQTAAAAAIADELEQRRGWDLSTPYDKTLGVCQGCYCVNKLSVHCPLETKLKHLPQENFDALHESCWVRTERAALPA